MTTDLQAMRGHTPVLERTWDSEVLDRRVMLAKVPLLSDADLRALRLELQEASASIRDQIELNSPEADPDWLRRARGKQRQVRLFVTACFEESDHRKAQVALERTRLKTMRVLQDNELSRRRAAKRARVVHDLLLQEWGAERTKAFYDKASAIADTLVAEQPAGSALGAPLSRR
jgi:hypothetical protein